MGALAEDEALIKLDGTGELDHRRACRPFADNCGFTLAEASQFVILFDDELALELGAHIYAGVGDVFVNADGFKKSIPGPGIELRHGWQGHGYGPSDSGGQSPIRAQLYASARYRHPAKSSDRIAYF